MEAFATGDSRWVLLFAQMQSGKTDTFLLVACEMLRLERIQNISIFSGNSETDLREQLESQIKTYDSKFNIKYRNYLKDNQGPEIEPILNRIISKAMRQIKIVWGSK